MLNGEQELQDWLESLTITVDFVCVTISIARWWYTATRQLLTLLSVASHLWIWKLWACCKVYNKLFVLLSFMKIGQKASFSQLFLVVVALNCIDRIVVTRHRSVIWSMACYLCLLLCWPTQWTETREFFWLSCAIFCPSPCPTPVAVLPAC